MKREHRLYNIILPVWMLIWVPSYLWLFIIPANWLVDWLVTKYAMKHAGVSDYPDRSLKISWKICIAGFVSDFIGAALLVGALYLFSYLGHDYQAIETGLGWNPFTNIFSILIILAAVILSGFCIYKLDRMILLKDGLTREQAAKTALWLAVLTAPYLYFLPASLFY